jgi:hypothetical protein
MGQKAQKRRVNPDTSVRFPQFWPPALPRTAVLAEASDIESSFRFHCGYNIRNAAACQPVILRKFPKAKNGVTTDDQSIGRKNAKKIKKTLHSGWEIDIIGHKVDTPWIYGQCEVWRYGQKKTFLGLE